MFKSDGSINPKYNSFKKTGVIAQIFENYWDIVYSKYGDVINKYRPNANKEIKKIIYCKNKDSDYNIYTCPECNDIVFIDNTCKSRMCSSCGYKYKNERIENIMQTAYNCPHRQKVFTIPRELRKLFFENFEVMINILFQAVRNTIYSLLNENYKNYKKEHKMIKYLSKVICTPSFFAFLHTFGRDLKLNPHIHILIAEIKTSKIFKVQKWDYFNFDSLSKRFQKILLDLIEKELGFDFKKERWMLIKSRIKAFMFTPKRKNLKA